MTTRVALVVCLLAACATGQQEPERKQIPAEAAAERLCGISGSLTTRAAKNEQAETTKPKDDSICGGPMPAFPVYPAAARQQGIQGTVHLKAVIGVDGSIQELTVIDGHPLLAPAAIEAVKKWKYKPYFVHGKAVEVATTINVNFKLEGSQNDR